MWSILLSFLTGMAYFALFEMYHMGKFDRIWKTEDAVIFTDYSDIINADEVPIFEIDVALPMKERYAKVIEHFKDDMVTMENFFLAQLNDQDPEYLKYVEDNLEKFREHQPDAFAFAEAIS